MKETLKEYQKLSLFVSQYNWKDIDFTARQKDKEMSIDWKKFEQSNKTIALNILFVPHNTKKNKAYILIKILKNT